MKKLLLLLLVGFNANGADKPFKPLTGIEKENFELLTKGPLRSFTGLEGLDGLFISVHDHSDKGIDKKAIENQVKLRLLQAGVLAKDVGSAYINIKALPYHDLIILNIQVRRGVTFKANGRTYHNVATVYDLGSIFGKSLLREQINKHIDAFLLDYLKANPKKTEP